MNQSSDSSLNRLDRLDRLDKLDKINKIFVINLEKRPKRLTEFKSRIPFPLDKVYKFKAVDGKNLTANEIKILYNFCPDIKNKNLKAGEIGCALSHYILWYKISKFEDDKYCLIHEDDVMFAKSDEFNSSIDTMLSNFKKDNYENGLIFIGGRFKPKYDKFKNTNNFIKFDNCIYKWNPQTKRNTAIKDRCTSAYLINPSIAKELVESFNSTSFENCIPIDKWMTRKTTVTTYDYFPHLCYSPCDYNSDIQGGINKNNIRDFLN